MCTDHASTVELLQAQLVSTRLECSAALREREKRTARKKEGAFAKVKLSLPRSKLILQPQDIHVHLMWQTVVIIADSGDNHLLP